jgi:hypothetical protein
VKRFDAKVVVVHKIKVMSIPKALDKQLKLPVSMTDRGEPVTLLEVVKKGKRSFVSLSNLSLSQRAKIVVERLKAKPEVKLAVLGNGTIDKERAIAEVEAESDLGKALIESEQYVIEKLIYEAQEGRLKEIIESIDG